MSAMRMGTALALAMSTALALGPLVSAHRPQIPQTATPSPTPTPAPTPARSDGVISGTVVDGVTKQPIGDAIVQLGWPKQTDYPEFVYRQFTDAKGRFVFTNLPPGPAYSVNATKPGYFPGSFGASGTVAVVPFIALTESQWFSTADVTLYPPASVSGQVTDEAGEPVVGVFVRLLANVRVGATKRWASGQVVLTDDRGVYRIGGLRPGSYVVMVPSVQASVPAGFGVSDVDSRNTIANEVTGIVDPMIDIDPNTRLMVRGYPVPPPAIDGRRLAYPMAFAGGRSIDQATVASVAAGNNRTNLDVRLEPVPSARISGMIDGPPESRSNTFLRLLVRGLEDLGWGGEAGTTVSAPDGSFTFGNVPAGDYVIDAPANMNEFTIGNMEVFYVPNLPRPPGVRSIGRTGGGSDGRGFGFTEIPLNGVTQWARTPVTVGARDSTGIVVRLQPTISVGGRLVAETVPNFPEPPSAPRFMSVQSAPGTALQGSRSSVSARNVSAGEFRIDGVIPGEYLFDGSSNTGWMIKSVMVAGGDYTYTPVDLSSSTSDAVVTFTNAIPELSGVVTTDNGAPAANVIVLAFPTEPAQWTNAGIRPLRLRTTQTSTAGLFRFRNLPAGRYQVIALPASQANAWYEPGFFQRALPLSTAVTFDWGDKRSITVKLVDVK